MDAIASTLSTLANQIKNANKIPADDFDKFDASNVQTSNSDVKQSQQKKVELLDQGKVLADTFDKVSTAKKEKAQNKKEKPVSAKASPYIPSEKSKEDKVEATPPAAVATPVASPAPAPV